MSFSKKRALSLLLVIFAIFLIIQQAVMKYGRAYRAQTIGLDAQGYDKLVKHEIGKLEDMWRKAELDNLIIPEKIASHKELNLAREHLKWAEKEIQGSEMRVLGVAGKKREFLDKVHAYYHNSVDNLRSIIDFLLAKEGKYSVKGNEINFETDSDAEKFRELVNQLSELDKEKQNLDAYILQHNNELQSMLSMQTQR